VIHSIHRNFNKYYFSWWRGLGIETVFIGLVIVDAIVYCIKHSGMAPEVANFLYIWQVQCPPSHVSVLPAPSQIVVSVVFVLEILGIAVVHFFKKQPRLFFEKIYFWCLMIIAVGGLISACVYNPSKPLCVWCNLVAVFQVNIIYTILNIGPA